MPKRKPRKMKIQRRLAKDDKYYFVLLAKNNEVLVTSETYASKANCNRAMVRFHSYLESGLAELDAKD